MLKYFNKRHYKDLSDALSDIRKEFIHILSKDEDVDDGDTYVSSSQSYIPSITNPTAASTTYNGPYKMILDGDRVRIVDGATYDPKTGTSDYMAVYVNGFLLGAKPFVSEPKRSDALFAMCFTSKVDADGNYNKDAYSGVDVVDLSIDYNNQIPANSAQKVWKRIGRLIVKNNNGNLQYTIAQDHLSGDMELSWYTPCWTESYIHNAPR